MKVNINDDRLQPQARLIRLTSAVLFAFCLTLAVFTIQAAAATTSVRAGDRTNEASEARVTVFDAQSGRQIANGMTTYAINGEQVFTFNSADDQSLVIVVLTAGGFVGSARAVSGSNTFIFAGQSAATMPTVTADIDGNAMLTYTDSSGKPVKGMKVSVVEWETFGNARRGKTNPQGQYNFNTPNDLEGSDFLAAAWKGDGAISLTAILNNGVSEGGGAGTQWPAF